MSKLNMKVAFGIIVWVFSAVMFSTNSWAITVGVVGDTDVFTGLSCDGANPSAANEIACFNTLGVTVVAGETVSTLGSGFEQVTLADTVTDVANTYALALPSGFQGTHFLLRTGNVTPGPNGATFYLYLFQNLTNTGYAVVDITNAGLLRNLGNISHITSISVSAVPLPAAVWMFMFALSGIFGLKRFGMRSRKA